MGEWSQDESAPTLEPWQWQRSVEPIAWHHACAATLHGWVDPSSPYYVAGHAITKADYLAALDAATTQPPYKPHRAAIRGR